MFEQAKNLRPGDVVIDRGRRFTVKRVVINPDTGMIGIINTDDSWHGEYHPEEYLGIVKRATEIQFPRLLPGGSLRGAARGKTKTKKGEIYVTRSV